MVDVLDYIASHHKIYFSTLQVPVLVQRCYSIIHVPLIIYSLLQVVILTGTSILMRLIPQIPRPIYTNQSD